MEASTKRCIAIRWSITATGRKKYRDASCPREFLEKTLLRKEWWKRQFIWATGFLTALWGLWLFPFATLTIKSGFLPKFLGVILIISGIARSEERRVGKEGRSR